MIMTTDKFIRRGLLAASLTVATWWFAKTYFRENWGWPPALVLGVVAAAVFAYVIRQFVIGKPAPFQLVLQMADENGGDKEDDQTFQLLHDRFRRLFPKSGDIGFDGFDTDGCFIWFYFRGAEEASVRDAILSQLEGCRIRKGSYFLSKATQSVAPPDDGPVTPLGDSRGPEVLPTVN